MTDKIELYPSLTFLFAAVNLAAWYFKGQPLFSWWWFVPIIAVQLSIAGAAAAVAYAATRR